MDPSLEERRAKVEHAERELHVREREERVAAEHRRLDDRARFRGAPHVTTFSHAGRVVFPNLAGLSFSSGSALMTGGIVGGGLFSFGSQSNDGPGGITRMTSISLNPSVDVFLGDHLTVGAALAATHFDTGTYAPGVANSAQDVSGYSLSATPRIGVSIDLGPVTLWPKLGATFGVSRMESRSATESAFLGGRTLTRAFGAELGVDMVFPLGRYLVFALGPTLAYEHSVQDGTPGARAFVGGGDRISGGMRAFVGVTF